MAIAEDRRKRQVREPVVGLGVPSVGVVVHAFAAAALRGVLTVQGQGIQAWQLAVQGTQIENLHAIAGSQVLAMAGQGVDRHDHGTEGDAVGQAVIEVDAVEAKVALVIVAAQAEDLGLEHVVGIAEQRRVAKRGARGEPVGAVIEHVEVAVGDDEPRADHEVLPACGQAPVAYAQSAVGLFEGEAAIGAAGVATGIAVALGGGADHRRTAKHFHIRRQRIAEGDSRLDVELLPVHAGAAVTGVAQVHASGAEVHAAAHDVGGASTDGELALQAIEVETLAGPTVLASGESTEKQRPGGREGAMHRGCPLFLLLSAGQCRALRPRSSKCRSQGGFAGAVRCGSLSRHLWLAAQVKGLRCGELVIAWHNTWEFLD